MLNIKYSIFYSFNIICTTIIIELNNISLTIIINKCFFKIILVDRFNSCDKKIKILLINYTNGSNNLID